MTIEGSAKIARMIDQITARMPMTIPAIASVMLTRKPGGKPCRKLMMTLATMYDQTAIQALVTALDDPAPEVRDQVLETLEAIKQIEDKKEYWREFAEGTR